MKNLVWQIVPQEFRFLLIGGINTLVSWLSFSVPYLLIGKNIDYEIILIFAFLISLSFSFYTNMKLVFFQNRFLVGQINKFIILNISIFGINFTFMRIAIDILQFNPIISQTVFVLISALVSYFGNKYFVFDQIKNKGLA